MLDLRDIFLDGMFDDSNDKAWVFERLIPLIADGKAKQYNPVYVYGHPHQVERFSEAVQLACIEASPRLRICCLSGRDFFRQIILGIQGSYEGTLRKRFRLADMLIFTDIDEIQGNEICMWEFFSLFDHYYEQGKMIIIGSSIPYSKMIAMEDRVMAQLQGGLVIDLAEDEH